VAASILHSAVFHSSDFLEELASCGFVLDTVLLVCVFEFNGQKSKSKNQGALSTCC